MLMSTEGCPNKGMIGVWMTQEEAFALEALVLEKVEQRNPRPKAREAASDAIEVGQVWHSDGLGEEIIEIVGHIPSEFETLGPMVAVRRLGQRAVWNVAVEDFGRVYQRLPYRREVAL